MARRMERGPPRPEEEKEGGGGKVGTLDLRRLSREAIIFRLCRRQPSCSLPFWIARVRCGGSRPRAHTGYQPLPSPFHAVCFFSSHGRMITLMRENNEVPVDAGGEGVSDKEEAEEEDVVVAVGEAAGVAVLR